MRNSRDIRRLREGEGDDGGSKGGGVGERGKPYGSSTNVLNYKSGGELVDCQVESHAGLSCWIVRWDTI